KERAHHTKVASVVAARSTSSTDNQVEGLDLTGDEIGEGEMLAVALEKTPSTHDPRPSPAIRSERAHRQSGRHPTVELDRHNLVVGHIVVTGVDAASVRALAERPPYPRLRPVGRQHGERPA